MGARPIGSRAQEETEPVPPAWPSSGGRLLARLVLERDGQALQSSFDEGKSFTPRARLSERPFSSQVGYGSERGLPDLGSRLGLVSVDSRALAVWSDTRAGTPASSRQDLGRAVVAFSDPPRIAGGLKWLLIIGGIAAILAGAAVLVVGLVWPGARVPLARLRRRA